MARSVIFYVLISKACYGIISILLCQVFKVWEKEGGPYKVVKAIKARHYQNGLKELRYNKEILECTGDSPPPPHLLLMEGSIAGPSDVYLIFPYEESVDLWKLVAENPNGLPKMQVQVIAWHLVRAIKYLTSNCSLVHADIKSENVLVSADGKKATLIDFGLMIP